MQKRHSILLLFIALISLNTYSQLIDNLTKIRYRPGAAILNSGDTIRGAFEFNDAEQNYRLLVFKDPITSKKSVYEPQNIKVFFIDSMIFHPKELKDGWVFMRLLIDDSLKVYIHKHFFTTNMGNGTSNKFLFEKSSGENILVSLDRFYPFKKRVSDFFSDDPILSKKIYNNLYTHSDIFKIAIEYNEWLRSNKK